MNKSYKKSKIAYLFFLGFMLGIAAYDQFKPRQEHVQIVLENKPQALYSTALIAKSN